MFMKPRLKLLSGIPALIIMAIIFFYSAQEATESSALSAGIVEVILEAADQVVDIGLTNKDQVFLKGLLEVIVRKAAHITEYAILAIAVAYFFHVHGKRSWSLFFYSEVVCVLYAMSDEFHQLFVLGRSGSLADVLIDGSGAAIGCFLFLLVKGSKTHKSHHKKS